MNFREDGEFGEGATMLLRRSRPLRIREAALVTAIMVGVFASIIAVGYWARHDRAVWNDICWGECG